MELQCNRNDAASGIKLYKCENSKLFKLEVWNRDQVGFLFRLCELLLRYKIEVADAEFEPKDDFMHANLTLRTLDADFSVRVQRMCKEVENFLANCEVEDPPNPDDPVTLERLSINLDLDLLNVTAFYELSSNDPGGLPSSEQGNSTELSYRLEVSCINQTGILAFLALVAFKSKFNIMRVKCGTPASKSAWLSFDLTTTSRKANQVIRTYLDIPYGAVSTSKQFSHKPSLWPDECSQSPRASSCIDSGSYSCEIWPPGCCDEIRHGTASNGENHEAIDLGNGDLYDGGVLIAEQGMKQHGFGTYTYNSKRHPEYQEYRGQWENGKKHGHGVLRFRNGAVYVGQWENGKRHGFGAIFEYSDPDVENHAMPSRSYEGEWRQDFMHGLGAEECVDSYYYGNYVNGARRGRGVKVMLDERALPIGCEVLDGERAYSMLDALEHGIEYFQQFKPSPCIPSVKSLPLVNLGVTETDQTLPIAMDDQLTSTAASENSDHVLHQEGKAQQQSGSTMESSAGSSLLHSSDDCMPMLASRSPSISARFERQSSNQSSAWLASPRLSPKTSPKRSSLEHMRHASPNSIAWMASPSLQAPHSLFAPNHGKSAPASPCSPKGATVSAPVSPAGSEAGDFEIHMEITEEAPPAYRSPEAMSVVHQSTIVQSHASAKVKNAPPSDCFPSPGNASRQTSFRRQTSGETNSDPKANSSRRAWTPDKRARTKRPILGPMLWSEDELAAFLSFIGLSNVVARNVQQCSLKGVDQLIQMSDEQLYRRFTIASTAGCVVMRKALKRFLALDRVQNNLSRLAPTHSRDDINLRDFIISPQDLSVGEKLSEGGYGSVYKALLKTQNTGWQGVRPVAVKEMTGVGNHPLSSLIKEGRIMAKIRHKNICEFIGICADRDLKRHQSRKQYIVSELMDCSLHELIHSSVTDWTSEVTLPLILRISAGICAGITYLHGNELVHADLKPQNILISRSSSNSYFPKICDFGHVAMRVNPSPHRLICTPHWAAPEALRQDDLSSAADVYSFGVVLWEMLSGAIPLLGYSYAQLVGAVGWAGVLPDMELLPTIPTSLRELLLSCLEFMPGSRPCAGETRAKLRQIRKTHEAEALSLVTSFLSF